MKSLVMRAVALLLALAPAIASAEPLELAQVRARVRDRHPLVLAALAERRAAEGERRAAAGAFDPVLKGSAAASIAGQYQQRRYDVLLEQPTALWGATVFGGYRLSQGSIADYDGKLVTNAGGEVRGGVRVPLLRDGPVDRRRTQERRAELSVQLARLSQGAQRVEVLRQAELRYWDWVGAGARRRIVGDWLDLAVLRDRQIARRAAAGDVPAIERAESQRGVLSRQSLVASLDRDLEVAAIDLGVLLVDGEGRATPPAAEQLPPALPTPGDVDLLPPAAQALALATRPDLQRLRLQQKQVDLERRFQTNQRLPAVDVVVAGSKDLGAGDPDRARPVVEAQVLVDIPLLGRGPDGRAEAAAAEAERLGLVAHLTEQRILADVQAAFASLTAAKLRVELATKEADVARTLAVAEARRFELGEVSMLFVNLREQAALEADVRRVDAIVDQGKALAQLAAVTARVEAGR